MGRPHGLVDGHLDATPLGFTTPLTRLLGFDSVQSYRRTRQKSREKTLAVPVQVLAGLTLSKSQTKIGRSLEFWSNRNNICREIDPMTFARSVRPKHRARLQR